MDVDHVVAPRAGAAWRVEAGQHLRIVDVEGGQTGDLFLVPTDDLDDGLSNGRTFDYGGTIRLERHCFVAVTACPASVVNGGGGGSPLGVTIGAAVG